MLHATALSGSSNVEARAKTMYNKSPGVLTFTNTRVQWVRDGENRPTVNVAHSKITNLFCTKEGAPKQRLKLNALDQPDPYMFHFTSPASIAAGELATFKRLILEVITQNQNSSNTVATPTASSTPRTTNASPSPGAAPKGTATTRASPGAVHSRASSAGPSKGQPYSFEIYQKVLTSTPELASLHRDLVEGGQITEAEFWEGREHLLVAEFASANQRKGKPSEIVVPRLKTGEQGQIMLTLTPQLLADIFEEFPIVQQAYSENVPKPLKEAEFWERYFSSKLFDRHRASSRNSVAKDDPIFDCYLEREDDEIEPLHPRDERVQLLLDLAATEEDHGETGNEKDITMRAGKRKNAIPLIRRFNEHSERLLQSALGDTLAKRPRTDRPEDMLPQTSDYYSQIELDDLHQHDTSPGISLQLQNAQSFLEGLGEGKGKKANISRATVENLKEITLDMKVGLKSWSEDLHQFNPAHKAGEAALQVMTANVAAQLETRLRRDVIPPSILQQMTTCATAANEFLRQFWTAIYPPVTELPTLANSTPAQKAARVTKMATYLSRTNEKVEAIIDSAREGGVDPQVMQAAFAPLLASVDRALETYKTRKR